MIYYVCLYVLSQSFIFSTFQEFLLCSLSSWKSILPWHHWEPAHQGSKPNIDRLSVRVPENLQNSTGFKPATLDPYGSIQCLFLVPTISKFLKYLQNSSNAKWMDPSCNLMQWSTPGRFVDYFAAVVFLLWVASVGYSFVGLRQVHKSFAL